MVADVRCTVWAECCDSLTTLVPCCVESVHEQGCGEVSSASALRTCCGVTMPCPVCAYDSIEWEKHPCLISGRAIVFVIREGLVV